jgi:hypothetical protein
MLYASGACAGIPLKSLFALRCASCRLACPLFRLILSREGAFPRYQAVGEDGDMGVARCDDSFGNMGFGLCIGEPSEPLRRLARGIP